MRWRRNKDREPFSKADTERHEAKATDRLRGLDNMTKRIAERDAAEVEARLRNMVYGTNRE